MRRDRADPESEKIHKQTQAAALFLSDYVKNMRNNVHEQLIRNIAPRLDRLGNVVLEMKQTRPKLDFDKNLDKEEELLPPLNPPPSSGISASSSSITTTAAAATAASPSTTNQNQNQQQTKNSSSSENKKKRIINKKIKNPDDDEDEDEIIGDSDGDENDDDGGFLGDEADFLERAKSLEAISAAISATAAVAATAIANNTINNNNNNTDSRSNNNNVSLLARSNSKSATNNNNHQYNNNNNNNNKGEDDAVSAMSAHKALMFRALHSVTDNSNKKKPSKLPLPTAATGQNQNQQQQQQQQLRSPKVMPVTSALRSFSNQQQQQNRNQKNQNQNQQQSSSRFDHLMNSSISVSPPMPGSSSSSSSSSSMRQKHILITSHTVFPKASNYDDFTAVTSTKIVNWKMPDNLKPILPQCLRYAAELRKEAHEMVRVFQQLGAYVLISTSGMSEQESLSAAAASAGGVHEDAETVMNRRRLSDLVVQNCTIMVNTLMKLGDHANFLLKNLLKQEKRNPVAEHQLVTINQGISQMLIGSWDFLRRGFSTMRRLCCLMHNLVAKNWSHLESLRTGFSLQEEGEDGGEEGVAGGNNKKDSNKALAAGMLSEKDGEAIKKLRRRQK